MAAREAATLSLLRELDAEEAQRAKKVRLFACFFASVCSSSHLVSGMLPGAGPCLKVFGLPLQSVSASAGLFGMPCSRVHTLAIYILSASAPAGGRGQEGQEGQEEAGRQGS